MMQAILSGCAADETSARDCVALLFEQEFALRNARSYRATCADTPTRTGFHPRIDRYRPKYLSAMRSTVKRADTAARQAARSISSMRSIASTAASRLLTRNPVTPSSISSGIDPRLKAMTGVPQASASTTDRPKGSSKLMRWSKARADPRVLRARRSADRAKINHRPVFECRRDLLVVIILVLNDPGHDQSPSRSMCRRDRFSCTFVLMNSAKKSRSSLPCGSKGKSFSGIPWWMVAA